MLSAMYQEVRQKNKLDPSKTELRSPVLSTMIERHPLCVPSDMPLLEVLQRMGQGAENCSVQYPTNAVLLDADYFDYALVTKAEALVGIITVRDVLQRIAAENDLKMLRVADWMTANIITLTESEFLPPAEMLGFFRQNQIRHLPVLDDQDQIAGVVTPNSICHQLQTPDILRQHTVSEVISPRVISAPPEASMLDLCQLMVGQKVSCIVIGRKNDATSSLFPLGIIDEIDIVHCLASGWDLRTLQAQSVMETSQTCLSAQDSLWTAYQRLKRYRVQHLVVTDETYALIGLVTETNILALINSLNIQATDPPQQTNQRERERMPGLLPSPPQRAHPVLATEEQFINIFNQTCQFMALLNPDGLLIEINQTALDFGGVEQKEVLNLPFWETYWWQISPETQQQLRRSIALATQGEFIRYEVDLLGATSTATIDFSLRPMVDEAGQVTLLIAEGRDISDRKQTEEALRQSEQNFANLAEAAPVGIFQTDIAGNCLYVNEQWCQLAGMLAEEAQGLGWIEGIHPDDRLLVAAEWRRSVQMQQTFRLEYRFRTPSGQVTWVYGQAVSETKVDGQISGYIGTITDITDRKKAEVRLQKLNQELQASKELAQVTLHSIGDAVIATDINGRVEYCNPIAEQLTGWPSAEAIGKPFTEIFNIIHEVTRLPAENPIYAVLAEGKIKGLASQTTLISRDGTEYGIEDSAAPIRDLHGQIIGAVMVFHDVTQSRQLTRQLSWQASHDPLTGLANRRQFEHVLSETLQDSSQHELNHVLCYLDLDHFKIVNDTCGHLAGDELLHQLSKLLKAQIRTSDLLARLGGDEFGLLLNQCSLEGAHIIAEKIRKAIHGFRFIWEDKTFIIGVSIGLVSFKGNSDTLSSVLSAADAACYEAKNQGRNRVCIYQTNDSDILRLRGEQQWSIRIKNALEQNKFCLHRQAIAHNTATHSTAYQETQAHYEILIRMIDEQGNLIEPGAFIPAAERYDLIQDIDRWVVQTFFAHLNRIQSQSFCLPAQRESLTFINLSGMSLGDTQFLHFLKEQFVRYDISPQAIGFEITETAVISNLDQATQFIQELTQLGCSFALDDFGSGLSSFGYLKALPVTYLKIDGQFIQDIIADPATYAIVESINHIGNVLGIKTIAESVENQALRDKIAETGVDYVQGYGISMPCPLES